MLTLMVAPTLERLWDTTSHKQDGTQCESSKIGGEETYLAECVSIESSQTYKAKTEEALSAAKVEKEWIKITYSKGIKMPKATSEHQWLEGGTVKVELNEWNVTLEYTNKSAAPKYRAVKGSTVLEGTLSSKEDLYSYSY